MSWCKRAPGTAGPIEATAPAASPSSSSTRSDSSEPHASKAVSDQPARGTEPRRSRNVFGALAFRDFRYLWVGSLSSHIGNWMQQVATSWLIYDMTRSPFLVGLSGVFLSVPFVITSLYAGTVVDRVD